MNGKQWTGALGLLCAVAFAPAQAADFASGEKIYQARCSSCHAANFEGQTLRVSNLQRPRGAPNLNAVAKRMPADKLRAWVAFPWNVNPKTSCDIRGLTEPQKDDVVTFVLALTKPMPKPEQERFKEDLDKVVAERAARRGQQPSGGNPQKSGAKKKGER